MCFILCEACGELELWRLAIVLDAVDIYRINI